MYGVMNAKVILNDREHFILRFTDDIEKMEEKK